MSPTCREVFYAIILWGFGVPLFLRLKTPLQTVLSLRYVWLGDMYGLAFLLDQISFSCQDSL